MTRQEIMKAAYDSNYKIYIYKKYGDYWTKICMQEKLSDSQIYRGDYSRTFAKDSVLTLLQLRVKYFEQLDCKQSFQKFTL